MKTALALITAALLAAAAPAGAKIVILDGSGAVLATPVGDYDTELLRWTDDGTALIGDREGHVVRVDVTTGAVTTPPLLDKAWAIGPAGHFVVVDTFFGNLRITVRAPDGRGLGAAVLSTYSRDRSGAWSADGTRFAVATGSSLLVFDTSTGAVVARATVPWGATVKPQAFAPDNSALLVGSGPRVLRVDLPSAAQSLVVRASHARDRPIVVWGAGGSVAATVDHSRIRVFGPSPADVHLPVAEIDSMRWSPDGSALAYIYELATEQRCAGSRYGLSVLVPGAVPRPVLPPTFTELIGAIWSPDGGRLAVQVGYDDTPEPDHRGRRHPWPKRIRREYGMLTRRGDAAIRRIVVRAARALRRGARRARTMDLVSVAYNRVGKRFGETYDTVVGEALAVELSKWLRSAGLAEIDALDELEFGC
ncbi:MAG: hypothetical protein V7607_1591 [Solirubrobacteraceae bacterium]